jgi:very-short-patch-repair endonuclease
MDDVDRFLYDLAELQHGALARRSMYEVGLSRASRRNWVDGGGWEPDGPRVLHRKGAPKSKHYLVMRAVLDAGPGAALSHAAAAAWWGLPGYDLRVLHVTRPRGITSSPLAFGRLHEVKALRAVDVTVLEGIPVVRPERTILELCGSVHPGRAERALDAAWSKSLLSGRSCRAFLEAMAASGRNGIVLLRQLLEDRPDDYVPPASNLEGRVKDILAGAGLGEWRRQVDTGGATWTGRVDFRHAVLPAILEVQSERYHAALTHRADDARRRTQLEVDGFFVAEVWDTDVWYHRADVVTVARKVVRDAGRGFRT